MGPFLNVLLPILIISGIGYLFSYFKKIELKTLADIVIYISTPALVFTVLARQDFNFQEYTLIAASAFFVILGTGLIILSAAKTFKWRLSPSFYLPSMFMNTAFIGYPVVYFALGTAGLSKAPLYDMVNGFLMFSLGIFILSPKSDKLRFLKIPFIYAALLGLIISGFDLKVPGLIMHPLDLLAAATIPLALFMLGYKLSEIRVNAKLLGFSLYSTFFRIIVGFLLALAFVKVFRLGPVPAAVVVLMSIMPAAINNIALSEEFEGETELIACAIAASTILGIFTIPLALYLINILI